MKEASLNIRIEPQIKNSLEILAQQRGKSMADIVASLIENYPAHEEALQKSKSQDKEIERLKGQVAILNVPRFEVLFDDLKGKSLNQRTIESKTDLLYALADTFRYELKDGEIEASSKTAIAEPIIQIERDGYREESSRDVFNWKRAVFQVSAAITILFAIAFAWRLVSHSRRK